jgi:hypothetical protein
MEASQGDARQGNCDTGGRAMTTLDATKSKNSSNVTRPGRLFVLELSGDRIHSMNPDGSDRKTIVNHCRFPDGIGVDFEAGHIYWTNMGIPNLDDGSIERADLDGGNRKVIVPKGGTYTPKQLHLDKENGKLYWCDREGMRVMRANLDGSQVETLVETGHGDKDRQIKPGGASGSPSIRSSRKSTGRKKARIMASRVASSAPTSRSRRARPQRTAPTSRCCSIVCRNRSTSNSM